MARGNNLSATNSFEGGMVSDLHVLTSPSNTVTHALNMELVTVGDNQYIFQNIKGNKWIVDLPKHSHGGKEYQFIPLGMKVSNNIAYILVGAFKTDGTFIAGGVGTFPSPNWGDLNTSGESVLSETFSMLHNYKAPGTSAYTSPLISIKFNFEKNRFIDMDIQGDFDGSVNILFTDNKNNPSIINSRFKRVESSQFVGLADRTGDNDGNIYSDDDWDRISLIQNNNFPITILDPSGNGEEGFEVLDGGYLRGGGYRYYLKYTTQEGNTTEILYESPLIPISNGGLGLNKDQVSDKMVRFHLSNLDTSYAGIMVFFAHFDGEDTASMEVFKINYIFTYKAGEDLKVTHTGLEGVTLVDPSEINVGFTPIDTIKTATIINDRLALAGASSTISESDLAVLSSAALDMTLWERKKTITKDYSDPETAAKYLGLWKGEVYEFAAVFMLLNKGLSPAFPIKGMDNYNGIQSTLSNEVYLAAVIGSDGFSTPDIAKTLINNKGLFRTSALGDIYRPEAGGEATRFVTYVEVNSSKAATNVALNKISTGFFIVRRQRVKNVLIQGMAVPALKLPSKYPSLPEGVNKNQTTLSASRRYLLRHHDVDAPTLGLNAPYTALKNNSEDMFNDDFDTVFVPQPTQLINVVTSEKSWYMAGGVGQSVRSGNYGETIDKDNKPSGKLHLAFYSCELDLNFPSIKGYLNGINPEIEVQGLKNNASPTGYTRTYTDPATQKPTFKSASNLIVRNAETISMDRSSWITLPSSNVRATLLESGVASYSKGGFTAKTDRALGYFSFNVTSYDETVPEDEALMKISFTPPYVSAGWRTQDVNELTSNSKVTKRIAMINGRTDDFSVYSTMLQSYSRYMGIEVSKSSSYALPATLFNYRNSLVTDKSELENSTSVLQDTTGDFADLKYTNVGHLANVFRSSTGRWGTEEIKTIYKYDSNKAYHAVTNRLPLSTVTANVFRGDGFISRLFKKTSYKNGVAGSKSATSADASDYGIGLLKPYGAKLNPADLNELERDDPGRGLYDVGQVIELATFSNINADIRSTEVLSAEDSLLYSGDRNFYPNKQDVFGDARPDSVKYNHGYTGDINPVSYNRIEENTPSFNTEFPNRILLSERNKTQSFFNAFRDLKGFNYRDYGVELGPIIKLMAIKNVLLSVHPTGVLAIGVDDRTLVAEGSDVYVNTAQSLSPNSRTVSDTYGSVHPESVVKTDTTVAGVDYNHSAIWLFEGDKLSIISEFAIKTILEEFKSKILAGKLVDGDSSASYVSRVYSTFNHAKHVLYVSYVAENVDTKHQVHVGTVSYSTVLQKWMSKISEGTKFSMSIGSAVYTTGFSTTSGIWKEDSLVGMDGKPIRTILRGVPYYTHEFEIVVNKEPALEKILDNIRMITNKSIPFEIVYTTTGDENDAAIDVWGSDPAKEVLTQKIITRNNSQRKHLRLGILDENAYYKNSGLYIEVGRIDPLMRKARGNKRVRDKSIKIKFIYIGHDETFLQGIISTLSISYN